MKQRARKGRIKKAETEEVFEFLSTGSTMLNLAISDKVNGGWPLGKINTAPGESTAGKTIAALHALTEAAIDPRFDEYELIHDDTERRMDFNLEKMFPPLVDRLITPSGILYKDLMGVDIDETGLTHTIQQLQARILTKLKKGTKFIWVVDSLDSITTDEEIAKENERAVDLEKGKESKTGTYAMDKAKSVHRILRTINDGISENKCMLLITQQLKQKIGATKYEKQWSTNGGEGPYFYSHVRPFFKKGAQIKKLDRLIGRTTRVALDKNSVTGKIRNVEFDIYYDLGIDDVGSMVSFLIKEKHWKGGSWIDVPELDLRENGKDKLIRAIEEHGYEKKLKRIVQKKWNQIEESLQLNRKSRY